MREACISGTREVASAITSSTLTTVAVFLPLGFVGGIVSQFFLPFALTVTFALLASLICALTVVPVLASLFIDRIKLDPDEGPQHHDTLVQRIYTPLLKAALHNRRSRWGVIGIAALLVVGAGMLVPYIPTQFLNAGSQKQLTVSVAPPSGHAVVGGPRPGQGRRGQAPDVPRSQAHRDDRARAKPTPASRPSRPHSPAAPPTRPRSSSVSTRARISTPSRRSSRTSWRKLQLGRLADPGRPAEHDRQQLDQRHRQRRESGRRRGSDDGRVRRAQEACPTCSTSRATSPTKTTQYNIDVDPNKAILDGTSTCRRPGRGPQRPGRHQGRDGYPGRRPDRRLPPGRRPADLPRIAGRSCPVGAAKVPLGSIATVTPADNQARISRVDQSPASTISADTTSKDTGGVSIEIQKVIDTLEADGKLPGVTVTLGGVTEADEQGLQRPVRLDGRRHPARLHRHGPGLQLADRPAGHHVQPAAGHDRRLPGAVPDPACDRHQRPDRLPDAHRHRGHQRDRPAGPGRATPAARAADVRSADAGRADPRPADPDDGHRHDPGPDAARRSASPKARSSPRSWPRS